MRRTFKLFLGLALLFPPAARAQEHIAIRVLPRFGLLNPDANFYLQYSSFAADTPTAWTHASLGRAAYAGLGLEIGLEDRGIFLRGELGRSFEGRLAAEHGYVQPRVLFQPPVIVRTQIDVPTALTFASAQLVFATRLRIWRIQPYFLIGGGGKWYDFGDPTESLTVEAILPSNGFTASADFGAGVYLDLFGFTFDLQARDTLNRYWGKNQHDQIFTGGLVWKVR